ncbi:hypothetical protein [Paraburkholderia dilworthii]|uniref:hypothetical protein n=1 Tax=Paraburkholderia dilworthii TaxID=948106 RepID=UPI001268BBB7|nr:hypothetical protein [Paraburkholderia dilworthii]
MDEPTAERSVNRAKDVSKTKPSVIGLAAQLKKRPFVSRAGKMPFRGNARYNLCDTGMNGTGHTPADSRQQTADSKRAS